MVFILVKLNDSFMIRKPYTIGPSLKMKIAQSLLPTSKPLDITLSPVTFCINLMAHKSSRCEICEAKSLKMYQTRFLTPKGKTSNFCSFHLEVPSQDIIDVRYKFPLIRHIVTTFNKRLLIDKPTEYSIFLLLWRPRCPFWSCRCTGTPDNFEGTYEQRTTIHIQFKTFFHAT